MSYYENSCFSKPKEYKFIYVHNVKDNIHKIKDFLNRNSNGIKYKHWFYDPDISDSYMFYSGKDLDNPECQFFILDEESYIVFDDFRKWFFVYNKEQFDYLFKECCLKDSTDIDFGLIEECDNI